MKRFNLTLGVCLLALFACLFAAAGVAQASILLVDRGLPTYGVYEGSSWGTNWSLQNNFAVGYFDPKDPANVPPIDVPGDDFTLPTGPTGPNPYQITDIRIWIQGSSTLTFSQEFNNISLLLGPIDGTLTNTNVTPTVTAVGFPNGQAPGTVLWQLDYAVNLTGTSGEQFSFAILPDAKPDGGVEGDGESYYLAFLESTALRAQTGFNPGGDGSVSEFYTTGGYQDSWQFGAVWGGVPNGDYSVQVFGTHAAASYAWIPVLPGTYNWNAPANWTSTSGDFPNSVDAVVNFNKAIECVGNDGNVYENIYLNGSVTVGSLTVHNGSAAQGDGSGSYAFGDGHGSQYLIYAGTGGSLNFQVSSGTALLKEWDIDAYGEPAWTIYAPINLVSDTVIDTATVNEAGFCLYNGPTTYAGGIIFDASTCPLGGSGELIKAGPNALWILSTNNNSFTGGVSVQDGYLMVADMTSLGTGASPISLGSQGDIGHLADAFTSWWINVNLTRPITLTGEGGAIHANGEYMQIETTIGGTGALILGKSYGNIYFDNNVANTFVGQTRVQANYVDVASNVTAQIFPGNVTIEDGGYLRLNAAGNVGGTVTVNSPLPLTSPLATTLMSDIGDKGNFFPTLTSSSYGIIDITQDTGSSPAFNAALAYGAPQLGNGYMVYGNQQGGETFRGSSLQPDLDNVYRFAVGYNGYLALADGGNGVLADVGGNSCSVEVSKSSVDGNGWECLRTFDANTFTGTLTIDALAQFSGYTQASGSPFGSSTGAVVLYSGFLELLNGGYNTPVIKGDTTFQGQSAIGMQNATLTLNSLTRVNNGMLAIRPENGDWTNGGLNLGVTDNLFVTTPPTVTNGMVAPYMDECFGRYFLTYSGTNGFIPATFTVTAAGGTFASTATDIVDLTSGGTVSGAQSAYAVRVTCNPNSPAGLNSPTSGDVLTIGSGGLILATTGFGATVNNSANINFGSAEGIIYVAPSTLNGGAYDWWDIFNKLSGTITGTNGLTIGSYVNGNHAAELEISGVNTGLTGLITINQGIVIMDNANALGPATNTIYINGRPGDYNAPGAILDPNYGGTLANNIVVGPEGGTLSDGWGNGFTVSGQISGSGPLNLFGFHDAWITLANNSPTTPNNWTGGLWIGSTNVVANNGVSLGTGPIVIGGYGDGGSRLHLDGNTNVSPTQRVIIQDTYFDDTVGVYIDGCNAPTFGSLEGNGKVYFNTNAVLTIGGNNLSTDFFGNISDDSQWWTDAWGNNPETAGGSLIKTGTGTLTLWGDVLLAGYWSGNTHTPVVTVSQGTLAINGTLSSPTSILGDVVVNGTGTLAGSGVINTNNFTMSGGGAGANLSGGTIDCNGYFWIQNGSYAGSSTINDVNQNGIEMDNGTFSGTHTINSLGNGYLYITGGAFGGTNTINTPGLWLDGGTFSSGGTVNITSGWGGGVPAGPGFYLNGDNVGGTPVVSGNASVNGNVFVWGGTFGGNHTIVGNVDVQDYWNGGMHPVFSGESTVTGNVTVGQNGTFKGGHTVNGNLTTSGGTATIAPSNTATTAETMTVVGNVVLGAGTTVNFNLATPGTIGGGINDLIDITGSLTLDGTLNVNGLTGFGVGTYTLFTYTGMLTGALAEGTMPAGGYTYTIDTSTTGQVNLDVATPWQPGDTNRDGLLNSLDIDAIYHNFGAPSTSQWKVDGDGNVVGQGDVTYELHTYFHTNYGDANLDTKTDFSDFQVLLDHWQVSGPTIGWAQGDFNGSYSVDFLDFQTLLDYWNPGGWSFAPAQTPEPASLTLLLLGGLALLRRKK